MNAQLPVQKKSPFTNVNTIKPITVKRPDAKGVKTIQRGTLRMPTRKK